MNTPTPNATPPAAAPVPKKVEGFKCKNPCFWEIIEKDGDNIEAHCHESGDHFEGTIQEFNARLRG
jgi:hypothetical protein